MSAENMQGSPYTRRTRTEKRRRRRQQRLRRRLLPVLLLVAVVAVVAFAIIRDGGDEGDAGAGPAAVKPSASPSKAPPKVWAASPEHPVRVWIGGDSMGGELGFALEPLLEDAKAFKPIVTFYKESTGFCRYDFYNWGTKIKAVSRNVKPDAAVVMIGQNDTQSVWRADGWIAYGSPDWKTAYGRRVGDALDLLLQGGARRVYLVGMPITNDSWRNARMRTINSVLEKQAAKRPGVTYVDAWTLFSDENGKYDPSWRAGDGVHFTVEGQQRLGDYVYKSIKKDWRPAPVESPGASPSPSTGA